MSYESIRQELVAIAREAKRQPTHEQTNRARVLIGQLQAMGISPRRVGLNLRKLGLNVRALARRS